MEEDRKVRGGVVGLGDLLGYSTAEKEVVPHHEVVQPDQVGQRALVHGLARADPHQPPQCPDPRLGALAAAADHQPTHQFHIFTRWILDDCLLFRPYVGAAAAFFAVRRVRALLSCRGSGHEARGTGGAAAAQLVDKVDTKGLLQLQWKACTGAGKAGAQPPLIRTQTRQSQPDLARGQLPRPQVKGAGLCILPRVALLLCVS